MQSQITSIWGELEMKRKIITIDEEKCNGCELCVSACHEGALQMVDGKAKLVSESYCDGLGDCLPECPTGAIKIEEREADAFDKKAVEARMAEMKKQKEEAKNEEPATLPCGCPSTHSQVFDRKKTEAPKTPIQQERTLSELNQWPCQIKLVSPQAPYFNGADLLIAADCTAFANANVHSDYMKNKITLIGCPKLDMVDYSEKLAEILTYNDIKSISVLRMSVPCCGGMTEMVKQALIKSEKMIPWNVTVISTNGEVIS